MHHYSTEIGKQTSFAGKKKSLICSRNNSSDISNTNDTNNIDQTSSSAWA